MAETRPWEGADLKVGGVELLQRMLKATAWIPDKLEDPSVVLRRLEGFNPSLRISANRAAGCKQAKALMGTSLNFKRATELRKLGRNEVKVLAEILIGHGNLGYQRHKIGVADSPLCSLCGEDDETSTHILCHCPAIAGKRLALTGNNCISESDISANSESAVLSVWRGLWEHA